MARPVVGIIGNRHLINDQYLTHGGGSMNSRAVATVSECLPLVIPADPDLVSVDDGEMRGAVFFGFVAIGQRSVRAGRGSGSDFGQSAVGGDQSAARCEIIPIDKSGDGDRHVIAIGQVQLAVGVGQLHTFC